MNLRSCYISLLLAFMNAACHRQQENGLVPSPGKTRAPLAIRAVATEIARGKTHVVVEVSCAEELADASLILRDRNGKNPSTATQFIKNLRPGEKVSLRFSLPGSATSENPVLDSVATIAGVTYRSSHEILLRQQAAPLPEPDEQKEYRKIKELR
jgi:hypothetical protein